jgi:hypothetical protein
MACAMWITITISLDTYYLSPFQQEIDTWWICNLPLFTLSTIQWIYFRLRRVKRDLKVNHTLRSLFCMTKCFPKLEKNLVTTQSLFFLVPNFAQMSRRKGFLCPFS